MGKTFITNLVYSVLAVADTASYIFIGITGAICGANAKALGVSMKNMVAGEAVPVAINGIVPVIAGGSISAGDPVTSDANGKAVKAASVAVAAPTVAAPTVAAPTVALAEGSTPVTSDAATPTITVTPGEVTAGEVTAGDVSGGVLPVAINGYALEDASEGDLVMVRLV